MKQFCLTSGLIVCCVLVLTMVLCSCKKDRFLQNEKEGKIELSAFLLGEIVKYGGSNALGGPTNTITNYVYSEDKEGFQVVCQGNKVTDLRSIFQAYYGNPVLARTNANGLKAFEYTV